MHDWQLTAAFHGYILAGAVVKRIEDNRYEILTPFQDTRGRIVLYASLTDDDRIRISDAGYLFENFLKQQDTDSPFLVEMGVQSTDQDGECRMENGEFVIYCTEKDFGQSVCTLAHGVILLGTSKNTMMLMIQVFKSVMSGPAQGVVMGGEPGEAAGGDLSWGDIEKSKFEA